LRLRAGHAGASAWCAASALGALVILPFFHDVLALSHLLLKTTPIDEVKNKETLAKNIHPCMNTHEHSQHTCP
jgi:hypothetical protein